MWIEWLYFFCSRVAPHILLQGLITHQKRKTGPDWWDWTDHMLKDSPITNTFSLQLGVIHKWSSNLFLDLSNSTLVRIWGSNTILKLHNNVCFWAKPPSPSLCECYLWMAQVISGLKDHYQSSKRSRMAILTSIQLAQICFFPNKLRAHTGRRHEMGI